MKVLFTAVVMLYLALDFGSPTLPGAVSFDIDESVEGVQLQRDPSPAPPSQAVTPERRVVPARVRVAPQTVGRRPGHGGVPAPLHTSRHLAPDPSGTEEG